VDLTAEIVWWRAPEARRGERALLLDRDGVLNRRIAGGYVLRYEDAEVNVPLMRALGERFGSAPFPVAIVSNQSCVGRGLLAVDALRTIMARFVSELERHGLRLDAWYCCPHAPEANCTCRKPGPALVSAALAGAGAVAGLSTLIGDAPSDMAAARAAGIEHPLKYSMGDGDATLALDEAARVLASGA